MESKETIENEVQVDDEDESKWIPLNPVRTENSDNGIRINKDEDGASKTNARNTIQNIALPIRTVTDSRNKKQNTARPARTFSRRTELESLQSRLEDKISVQNHLVNHPVNLFWQRFLVNFLRQLWVLDLRIRLGVILFFVGFMTRILVWSTWFILHPRYVLLSTLFLSSVAYVDPFDIKDQIKGSWKIGLYLIDPASNHRMAMEENERCNLVQVRRLSLVLFLIPTMLEVRTFSFLSQIEMNLVTQFLRSLCIFISAIFLLRIRIQLNDIFYYGLLMLYGSSLCTTIFYYRDNETNEILHIAALFLTSTSTLLLFKDNQSEWLSYIIRRTFRSTLQDVLSSVGERVAEDEMLQLAILRWIYDFWASKPSASATTTSSSTHTIEMEHTSMPINVTKKETEKFASSSSSSCSEQLFKKHQANTVPSNPSRDIQWEELLPMLSVEIDQMKQEVDVLQSHNVQLDHKKGDYTNTQQNLSDHIVSDSDQLNASASSSLLQKYSNQQTLDSLSALKSMLLSFHVDERADQVVTAYTRAVESFPPKKETAVTISFLRRCPATITLVTHIFLLKDIASLVNSGIVLCPFIAMEVFRIFTWIKTCEQYASAFNNSEEDLIQNLAIPTCLKKLNSMTIILSPDFQFTVRPPSLLLVWHNIVSSVSALQSGLTTARCAARCSETAAVAVDFAGSAMSLANLGMEVSQRGFLHGLTVLMNELMSIHGGGRSINSRELMEDDSITYTRAAVRIVHSGQKMVSIIDALSKDKNAIAIIQPFLDHLGMIIGRKWLWGKDDKDVSLVESDHLQDTSIIESCEKRQSSNAQPIINHIVPVPIEELSEIMDMIATSYEQGLIDETEKDEFFQKLSELAKEELFDRKILNAMRRTLTIVLDHGSKAEDDRIRESVVQKSSNTNLDQLGKDSSMSNGLNLIVKEEIYDSKPVEEECGSNSHNDACITFGIAAFSIVAGGVLMKMGDGGPRTRSNNNNDADNSNTKSTIEIIELPENDNEKDGWIDLA